MRRYYIKSMIYLMILLAKLSISAVPQVVARYEVQLAQEWQAIEKEMLGMLGITKDDWICFLQEYRYKYDAYEKRIKKERKDKGQPLSTNFKNLALQLFKKIKQDPKKVDIIRDEANYRLKASKSAIYVSEDNLANDTPCEIEASLLHELGHVVHADDEFIYFLEKFYEWYCKPKGFIGQLVKSLCPRSGKTKQVTPAMFNTMITKIKYFHEKKEDFWSGLHSLVYAKALVDIYKRLKPKKDIDTPTHPCFSKRIEYMQNLCQDLENDPDMCDGQLYVRHMY